MSCSNCENSMLTPGTLASVRSRIEFITSSIPRVRLLRNRTEKSPRLDSVRNPPSCVPVRREKAATSGVRLITSSIFPTRYPVSASVPVGGVM